MHLVSSYTLFIFEGEKVEKNIYEAMRNHFLNDVENTIVICAFCTHIYTLQKKIKRDPDLDVFMLLRDIPQNEHLQQISRVQISEIYMFFDYDGHIPGSSDEQIIDLLSIFNNETEHGKLYISYPMVEALKHPLITSDFKSTIVSSAKTYKAIINTQCFIKNKDYNYFDTYTKVQWNHLIDEHTKKMNYIMTDEYISPTQYFSQESIFLMQKEKYIFPVNKVSVLSAFPIFLLEFYGISKLNTLIGNSQQDNP